MITNVSLDSFCLHKSSCRKQIVTFLVSSLTEPDIFGPNSETALADLYQLLSTDNSGMMPTLLKDLADELSEQNALESVLIDYFDYSNFSLHTTIERIGDI